MTSYATIRGLGRVEVGAMRLSEKSFVLNSWVQSQVDGMGHGAASGSKHRHAYLASVGYFCDELVRSSATAVLVARDAECAARAYGWIAGGYVGHIGAAHWCFVKRDHRREGVATLLLEALRRELDGVSAYTHKSRHNALCERKGLTFQALQGKRSA